MKKLLALLLIALFVAAPFFGMHQAKAQTESWVNIYQYNGEINTGDINQQYNYSAITDNYQIQLTLNYSMPSAPYGDLLTFYFFYVNNIDVIRITWDNETTTPQPCLSFGTDPFDNIQQSLQNIVPIDSNPINVTLTYISGVLNLYYNGANETNVLVSNSFDLSLFDLPLTSYDFIDDNQPYNGTYNLSIDTLQTTPTPTPGNLTTEFNTLFLTEGILSYFFLLIILILVMVIGLMNKYGALVAVPFGLIVSVYYLANGCGWHFILLLFVSMGIMDLAASGKIKG